MEHIVGRLPGHTEIKYEPDSCVTIICSKMAHNAVDDLFWNLHAKEQENVNIKVPKHFVNALKS